MNSHKTAIILANLGAPASNSRQAVKAFLIQFYSDRHIFTTPSLISRLVFNFLILPLRVKRMLLAYHKIGSAKESPLLSISLLQQIALQKRLGDQVRVEFVMRYGEPSAMDVIRRLVKQGYGKLIILPLFAQNSALSSGTICSHIEETLKIEPAQPHVHFIRDYHAEPAYILALADSVREHWNQQQRQRFLMMSFHTLRQRPVVQHDPYYDQCMGTAHLLATILGLSSSQWMLSFHDSPGETGGFQPGTGAALSGMAQKGLREVDVICPGFGADCLQTLHDLQIENRDIFLQHGGEQYYYIPCLNERADHIEMMAELVRPYIEKS